MRERRSTYREKESLEAVKVSVAVNNNDYAAAKLIDLSARGAAVEISVPFGETAELPAESTVILRFEVEGIDPISGIRAVIRNDRQADSRRVIGVEIIDWKALHSLLPTWLFSKFNRRRHYRVTIAAKNAVEVSVILVESGQALTASLADISISGGQLVFRSGEVPNVEDTVRVQFHLPGSDAAIDLIAIVKGRWTSNNTQCCGIEFQDMSSAKSMAQEQNISRYVMERQRQLTR